jgi:hypothetical protein
LFSNGRHLLQQLRVLLVGAVGGQSPSDYVHGSFWELRLYEGQHLVRDRLR